MLQGAAPGWCLGFSPPTSAPRARPPGRRLTAERPPPQQAAPGTPAPPPARPQLPAPAPPAPPRRGPTWPGRARAALREGRGGEGGAGRGPLPASREPRAHGGRGGAGPPRAGHAPSPPPTSPPDSAAPQRGAPAAMLGPRPAALAPRSRSALCSAAFSQAPSRPPQPHGALWHGLSAAGSEQPCEGRGAAPGWPGAG